MPTYVFVILLVQVEILEMLSIIFVLCSVLLVISEILQAVIYVLKPVQFPLNMLTQSLDFVSSKQAAHHPTSMLMISPGNVLHYALKANLLLEILLPTTVTLPVHGLQELIISKIHQPKHVYRLAQLILLILQTIQLKAVY